LTPASDTLSSSDLPPLKSNEVIEEFIVERTNVEVTDNGGSAGMEGGSASNHKIDDPKHDRWWFTLWPMWAHKYPQPTISKFAELYSTYMWNPEEYIHRYLNQIYYLQLFFEKYNIKYLFFQSFYQHKDMHIKDWRDDPYKRHYNGQPDQILWELIDSTRFMHKNEDMHSFHNYIKTKDTSPNNKDAFIIMHPSELAHTWWAEHVYEYCTKNNLC
jgi:hypothetical protein